VTSYAQRVGLSSINSNRVWLWANHRRQFSSAYTNLVDAALLRSNLNHTTLASVQTFKRTNTISLTDSSTMQYTAGGLYLPGSATQRAYWLSVPSHVTNTVILQARVWNKSGTTHNGNDWFKYWNGTYASSPYSAQMLALNNGQCLFQTYSEVGSFASSGQYFDRAGGVGPDGWMRTICYGQDGSGQYISLDGVWGGNGQTTNRLGGTATGFTAGFTNIQIGFQNGSFYVPCQVQSWALYDRRLTRAEELVELEALRYLDGTDINHIAYGDSRIVHIYGGDGLQPSWYGRLENYASLPGRFYDGARSGSYCTNLLNSLYLTNISPWFPNGKSVKETYVWMLTGVNDSGASISAAATWTAYSNTVFALRAEGCRVKSFIPCLGNAYGATESVLAGHIRTNAWMFDEIIEMGQLINNYEFQTSYSGVYYSPDNLHFQTNTAMLLADWIGSKYKRTFPRSPSPILVPETVATGTHFWTNTLGWVQQVILFGGTVTGVSLGTNQVGGVTPLTINVSPRQWIAITNSVAPTMRITPAQ